MTIEGRLRHDRENKDGTRSLRIYVSHQGRYKFYPTKIRLKTDQWDDIQQKVKGLPKAAAQSYNAIIQSTKDQYRELLESGVPADQLKTNVASRRKKHYLINFLNLFIREAKAGLHKISVQTIKNYNSAKTRLIEYCKDRDIDDLAFEEVDMDWYRDYYMWLKEKDYGKHAFGNHIKIVKRILREAHKRKLHDNTVYQDPDFKAAKAKTEDKIYLTESDIEKLEQLDLSLMPHLERERDRFLVSYYFLMRWKDSTLINKYNVVEQGGRNYVYTAHKTDIRCIVPITDKAMAILEKHNFQFGQDSNQKCNDKLKEIGAMAGISEIVHQGTRPAPKYKFITTHTARRSAATNLYMQGMDLETIARLGGWKKLSTLKIYLRASGMDVVQVAKKFDFFK